MSTKLFVIGIVLCVFGVGAEAFAKGTGTKVRPKHLTGEAEVKGNAVNFEDGLINGTIKTPLMSSVGAGKSDKNYDFVKIRLRWHPEMVASAANLD